MSATGECRAASQSNSPGNRFCQSVCSLRCWSISRAFIQMFSRETPSDSRKCSHTSSFLTTLRATIRSVSINCASFMAYGNTKNRGLLKVLFTRTIALTAHNARSRGLRKRARNNPIAERDCFSVQYGSIAVRTTANAKTATAKANAMTRTRRCSNFPDALAKKSTVANKTVFARY